VSQARRQDIAAGGANNQEGPKTRRGGHILKILYEMYASNQGVKREWGAQISNGEGRAPLALWCVSIDEFLSFLC